jgi:hypothetical protein
MPSCFDTELGVLCSFEKGQTGPDSLEVTEHRTPDSMPFNTSLAEQQSNVSRSAGDISCASGLRYQTPTLRFLLPIPCDVNSDFVRIKKKNTPRLSIRRQASTQTKMTKTQMGLLRILPYQLTHGIVEHSCLTKSACSGSAFSRNYSNRSLQRIWISNIRGTPNSHTVQYH